MIYELELNTFPDSSNEDFKTLVLYYQFEKYEVLQKVMETIIDGNHTNQKIQISIIMNPTV